MASPLPDRTSMSNGDNPPTTPTLRQPVTQNGAMPRTTSQTTYRPSYMSHVPTTSRTDSVAMDIPKASPRAETPTLEAISPQGLLLVLIANAIHASTLQYLEMLLSRQTFSGLVIAATQEQEALVKKLKMDIFGLIGRMRKEIGVSVHLKENWSQASVETIVQEFTRNGESIQGVLCCPDFGSLEGADVLSLESEDLERAWKDTTAFLHAASRATMPSLLATCSSDQIRAEKRKRKSGPGPHGPFFLVTGSATETAVSQITRSACTTLLYQLERATKSDGLSVGHTGTLLIPDPVKVDDRAENNGVSVPPRLNGTHDQEDEPFIVSESPTKLWSLYQALETV